MNAKEVLLKIRILGLSVLFHISIIIAIMMTYYTVNKTNKTKDFDEMTLIEIQFTNTNKSSGKGSTIKNNDNISLAKPTARSIENKVIKVEPLEEIKSDIIVKNEIVKVSKNKSDIEKNENSEKDGEGTEGKMLTGTALGNLDFDGEGVFGRKVVYHAPIKKIAEKDGRVAINIAINRRGKVTGAAINKKESTITDRDLLVKALEMILRYRFESDYTAPKIQYGKFTFIFDLENK